VADIVKRLRRVAQERARNGANYVNTVSAAEEIERLRAHVAELEAHNAWLRVFHSPHFDGRIRRAVAGVERFLCCVCDAPATCWGKYDDEVENFYCDKHCDHGNEGGWCNRLPAQVAPVARPNATKGPPPGGGGADRG